MITKDILQDDFKKMFSLEKDIQTLFYEIQDGRPEFALYWLQRNKELESIKNEMRKVKQN